MDAGGVSSTGIACSSKRKRKPEAFAHWLYSTLSAQTLGGLDLIMQQGANLFRVGCCALPPFPPPSSQPLRASTADDAEWEETDFDQEIEKQREFEAEQDEDSEDGSRGGFPHGFYGRSGFW